MSLALVRSCIHIMRTVQFSIKRVLDVAWTCLTLVYARTITKNGLVFGGTGAIADGGHSIFGGFTSLTSPVSGENN